ncbi:MAG TPA: hypothetical protein VNX40_02970 [Mucilaginibacter sp.]|nr:hypothetical protein [Mucilaginibacter sp.]
MKRCTYLPLIWGILCLIVSKNSFSQDAKTDSSSQQGALNSTLSLFNASIGKQSALYNGTEYTFYDPIVTGNAYFSDMKAFTPGSVNYNGITFRQVPMLYDIYSDQLVVLLYNNFTKFVLVKEKVKSFDYLDHHFINIDADSLANNTIIQSGYYDELYNDKLQVLVKRKKDVQTTSSQTTMEQYYNPVKSYYLRKNNVYYIISSKGSMLDILKDKKKQLQQYIRTSQINFRKDPEEAMVKIASYYDQLSK